MIVAPKSADVATGLLARLKSPDVATGLLARPPSRRIGNTPLRTTAKFLEQPISTIDQFPINDASFGQELMQLHWTSRVNMENFMPVRSQPIRYQHAMAAEVNSFGAHVSGPRFFGQLDQFSYRTPELLRQHVIGVVAKTGAAQRKVG